MRRAEVVVEDVAFGGKGVARDEGKVVFIPYTIDGERIAARIVREKKRFAEGEIDSVVYPSEHRTVPRCPYFGRCGGCSYQHISYEHQLQIKQRQVEQILQRIGRLDAGLVRPIIPSAADYNYRNRITVHVEEGVIGFYRRDVHRLIDVETCPISRPEVNDALSELRGARPRDGHYTLRAASGPSVFTQTNDQVADELARLIGAIVEEEKRTSLIDAYCGTGFFAKRLRSHFQQVIGLDWDRFAIEFAQQGAGPGETYVAGDVDEQFAASLRQIDAATSVVIFDPPATGLTSGVRTAVSERPVRTLIYVSCNPPTLARDLSALGPQFEIKSVTPLDMFPQTAEIEVMAHLEWRRL